MAEKGRDLIKGLTVRRQRMDRDFTAWEPHFRELRDWIEPALGRYELEERREDSTLNKKIIDTTARHGLRTLTSGLMAGMTSPSRPWFTLGVGDDGLNEHPEVKEWAHVVQTRMYAVLKGSNAYRALNTCYRNLGLYGTYGGLIVGDFEDVIHTHSFPMGRYRIAEGRKGKIEHMMREVPMTYGALISRFGIEGVSPNARRAYESGRVHDLVTVCHAVDRRLERDPLSAASTDKPFSSVYWEKATDHLLEVSGFGVNPILAPRWESVDGEPWSVTSPGMQALGDARQLQAQHRDKAIAVKKSYDPPLIGVMGAGTGSFYRNVPGGITTTSVADLNAQGLRPVHEVRTNLQHLREDIFETQKRIERSFFVDLFLMMSNSDRREVTAREIAERHEEKLLVLGPVLEALDHDLLQPMIQATFHHMEEAGIVPPPPDVIVGRAIQVEYTSALAQAQKAVGVAPIERTIGFAATLEQIKPGSMDLIDSDAAIRMFADQIGPPPSMIHTPREVEQIRKARADAARQQQMIEAAQPLAQAASLISEASARGEANLSRSSAL